LSKVSNYSVEPNESVLFRVLYEDEDVVVVDKPSHLVTQPGLGHDGDTLLNGMFAKWGDRLQNLGRARDFGLLHRLDRETSGVLIVALRPRAYDAMRLAFSERRVAKYYWAVSTETPSRLSGVIKRPIAEYESDRRNGKKMARISSGGKPAVTAYRVLSASALGCVLECRAVTGRLHQVRVHLEAIGCPVSGDGFYGPPRRRATSRLALHAHRVTFVHPVSGALVDVKSGWPKDLKGLLAMLKLQRPDLMSAMPPKASFAVEGGQEVDDDGVGDEHAGAGEA